MTGQRKRIPPPPGRSESASDHAQDRKRAHAQMRNWSLGSGLTGLNHSPLPPAIHDMRHFKSEVREVGGYFLGRFWALLTLPYRLARKVR